jgi:sugar phosphate isomerase/epimerase
MMRLSTQTEVLGETFGYEAAVKILGEVGFDCYDFSMFSIPNGSDPLGGEDYMQTVLAVKKVADETGLVCNQSHAPFPSYRPGDGVWNSKITGWIIRALEITSVLGGKICIVHPWNDWSPEENAERLYQPLLPYCKKYNVKIAVENMWNWPKGSPYAVPCACSLPENFVKQMQLLDPEWFVACLDLGHAAMFPAQTSVAEMIVALGDRLQALHIHDNDRHSDLHAFPYTGAIDWESVYSALKQIGYQGDLTFEADCFLRKYPKELYPAAEKFLNRIGRYMLSRLSN